jgi:pyroglutamyl-peptidase
MTAIVLTAPQPFLTKFPKNSSWEIASTLPSIIPASQTNKTPIHIYVYHEPIRVAYNTVLDLVPKLLPPGNPMHPVPDIILHIGLAAGRSYFAIEQGSRGRGYGNISDVDRQRFDDSHAEEHFPPSKYPATLSTSFDTADVLACWKASLASTAPENGTIAKKECPDIRISTDAGNFLCGFIYYNSLAHYFSIKENERPVIFLHVPDLTSSEEKMKEGWDVTVALVKALVESRQKAGGKVVDGERQHEGFQNGTDGVQTDNNFA